MVVRMRATRSHTANRRSHHALNGARLSKCGNCGAMHRSHYACQNCGKYGTHSILDVQKKIERKEKRLKEKQKVAVK